MYKVTMKFLKILLTLCMFSTTTPTTANTCQTLTIPEVLLEVEGKALLHQNYATLMTEHLMLCGIRCMRQRKCKSVNYRHERRLCMLNTANHTTAPDEDLVTIEGIKYYSVEQWDQKWLGSCANHTCQLDRICVSKASGFRPGEERYLCVETLDSDVTSCNYVTRCTDCATSMHVDDREFNPVGCYHSHVTNVLPTLVADLRGDIVWTNSDLNNIIEKCAEMSKEYDMFGVEFYGNCYAGNVGETEFDEGEVDITSCVDLCRWNVGAGEVMFVYLWSNE